VKFHFINSESKRKSKYQILNFKIQGASAPLPTTMLAGKKQKAQNNKVILCLRRNNKAKARDNNYRVSHIIHLNSDE